MGPLGENLGLDEMPLVNVRPRDRRELKGVSASALADPYECRLSQRFGMRRAQHNDAKK